MLEPSDTARLLGIWTFGERKGKGEIRLGTDKDGRRLNGRLGGMLREGETNRGNQSSEKPRQSCQRQPFWRSFASADWRARPVPELQSQLA